MEQKLKRHTALKIYDISRWCYLRHLNFLAKVFYRINNVIFQCSIAYESVIEDGVRLCHPRGVMINKGITIKKGTAIFQNVAIGAKVPDDDVDIVIGENCIIGANACILGTLKIGNNVHIGANTVVDKSIPADCTVVGTKINIISIKKKVNKKKPK